MSVLGTITNVHIRKLDHQIHEIRLRALDNVVSKLDLGFECDCSAVKKELLVKLFKWFSTEPLSEEAKVLDLMIRLIKSDNGNYLNSFGRGKFLNELKSLRLKLHSKWHDKLKIMEEIASDLNKRLENYEEVPALNNKITNTKHQYQSTHNISETDSFSAVSPLDGSLPFDLTTNDGDTIQNDVPKRSDSSIKWLVMPWQVLVKSDQGILAQLENGLCNSIDVNKKITNCQFITNVILQDFAAEIFLHRPTTVHVLLNLLDSYKEECTQESQNLIIAILKTLYKLTRALRFRINYYCDPSIAHKPQKVLLRNFQDEDDESDQRMNEDQEYLDQNYHPSQIPERECTRSPNLMVDFEEESVLQLQQMFIPNYCTETLINILKLVNIPSESDRPLKIIRYIADLVYELDQLLIVSVMPTVWFCNDNIALNIQDSIKIVFELLSEILDYFGQFPHVDYHRVTYIYFLWLSVKLIGNIVPLEVADQVIPNKMKLSMSTALMDAPIYLMYKPLHVTLQQYARRFRGSKESALVKLLDETRLITKSMKSAISLMKAFKEQTYSEELKVVYSSKLSLVYHKNFKLIRKFMILAQNKIGYKLSSEDKEITTKMLLALLAHSDGDVQEVTYYECHCLVSAIFTDLNARYSWKNLIFLLESAVLTEIICYGVTHENEKIQKMAEEILLFLLKGKVELTESGWLKFLEALVPVLPLIQCLANPASPLGKFIIKMLDPDMSSTLKLPFIEVLRGNIRLLFSQISDAREEAICRIFWLLGQEKDSASKLPRLSTLHGLPLSSIFAIDKQVSFKRSEGHYPKSNLVSTLEMLRTSNIEPKVRKSALVQISVLVTDQSLHKVFITENGLKIILDIFSKALIEREFSDYPDSVIPIITILKHLVSSENSVRIELSNRIDVYNNILRSLFLFSNNECIKNDATHLLALLLYSGYIMRLTERTPNNPYNISLPHIITIYMRLPFTCKAHWKTSVHRRSDISISHRSNVIASTFLRQYWAWQWNDGEKILWKKWEDINDPMIMQNLMLRETELACLSFTSLHFYSQRQLFSIQNSITHKGVFCAIDYLTMYLKLCHLINYENFENVVRLPWENTFERFLQAHPNNKDDYELFDSVLNFLHLYLKTTNSDEATWVFKAVKKMMKSFDDWIQSSGPNSGNVHQSMLKLTRACSLIDTEENEESQRAWISFVQLTVSHVFSDEFYNLAFLEWVLSTLTYVIVKCQWKNNEELLMSVGTALIQLVVSFSREGSFSFKGLTNVRNCMISLNHVLYQMQNSLTKNHWIKFWYGTDTRDDRRMASLTWLPLIWRSRDPLIRASALQLLASLINGPHTALQLLNAIDSTPEALCYELLYFVTCRDEACIVKEYACLAMSHLIKNSSTVAFQYLDGLNPSAMLSYVKETNVYQEIAAMCANCYMLATLDVDVSESSENGGTQTQSLASSRTATSVSTVPKTIYYLYNSPEDIQGHSENIDDDQMEFITTPSMITSLCSMLNYLIDIGRQEVIREIFENSVHKHLMGCFGEIPKSISGKCHLEHYSNVLEMYTKLCTVLTDCIINSLEFASIVTFSPEFIRHLFDLLNEDLYFTDSPTLVYLRNQLGTEILKFLVSLTLTENQHSDAVQIALSTCNIEVFANMLYHMIKNNKGELGMSAIGFLTFLLSIEMQKQLDDDKSGFLRDALDTKFPSAKSTGCWNSELQAPQTANKEPKASPPRRVGKNKNPTSNRELHIGAEICKELMVLYVALNHTKLIKKTALLKDKNVVTLALSNLLSVSVEAKKLAIEENFPATCFMVLKEIYVKLNSIPIQTYKTQIEQKKVNPLIMEVDSLYVMLMNFMYDSKEAKEIFAKAGLADVVHKLWAYTSMNRQTLVTSLKLLSNFTSDCLEASQSLPLTTVTPGVGLRKTPNSISLVHVIVQMVIKEIDSIGRNFNSQKLSLALQVLRNAIHNHDCRVVISKSNLLQFFTKIHPSTTKRTKLWQVVELHCLEFLIDFTFYEEGQMSVSKAVDSLEVLITLARTSSGPIKQLAMATLRNLAYHQSNRARLLGSAEFLDLLLVSLEEGSRTEIESACSTLWPLIGNNQKGKLIARSAGFAKCIQTAISRLRLQLSVPDSGAGEQERDLIQILEYVLEIMEPQ
ncbi:rotatin [Copidosoma floridanum]|uniref:rotatin n=1 Tax=Copidosoma floridanum TaxID=29053 RepID=UPI0006C9DCF0|nr:rotatin [Copidosoma floridanum]